MVMFVSALVILRRTNNDDDSVANYKEKMEIRKNTSEQEVKNLEANGLMEEPFSIFSVERRFHN
ncbi:hypothetical protein Bca52824_027506 [Brassica carinata]|uniref:Uncharacterized protein n=1 Tax=Brassica carinata TaxID=52824 RepID=A0A8X7VAL4_BRACI|nr:hypothetical protein Bca52824_027506 [Brassica carinata]